MVTLPHLLEFIALSFLIGTGKPRIPIPGETSLFSAAAFAVSGRYRRSRVGDALLRILRNAERLTMGEDREAR